ncbi:MAG: transcriptional regulator [Hyphomicrobiales bacterium]|nr:MAG: transcriptional regulator [Hyphomicrobiales bacterium]
MDSDVILADFQKMAGFFIRRLNQISVSIFADRMTQGGYDFTPVQFAALSMLSKQPGMDQATLAGLIAYDRVTLGGVVDRLEAKGLVDRRVSKNDRRAKELFLTSCGEQVLAKLVPVVTLLQEDILAGLNDEEKGQLLALMEKATLAGNEQSRVRLITRKAS